jgi:hypothetical protein
MKSSVLQRRTIQRKSVSAWEDTWWILSHVVLHKTILDEELRVFLLSMATFLGVLIVFASNEGS